MLRPLYIIGSLYVAFSALVLLTGSPATGHVGASGGPPATTSYAGPAGEWFQAIRPHCNSVEVATRHQWMPPPATEEGWAYSAACYALAGKIDLARQAIERVSASDRWRAAGIVFNVAHPVADAGDDLSAGPIMELVVEFWPNHYMALYHAGMSRYALGHRASAEAHLRKFLEYYDQNDGWRRNALAALAEMEED